MLSRRALAAFALAALAAPKGHAMAPRLKLHAAGKGSAFLPYAEAVARVVNVSGAAAIDVVETGGSNDNLRAVDGMAHALGTVFLGSAHAAISGTGFAQGKPQVNLRALFPMYETAFHVAAPSRSGIARLADLDGKRVGAGPANGPAEGFLRAAAEIAGVKPQVVSGSSAELTAKALAGEIDALWQGAIVPVPALTAIANAVDAVVFGLDAATIVKMRERFAYMAALETPPGAYRGQTLPITSVAAWNFVLAHKDLSDDVAYAMTKAALSGDAGLAAVSGGGTVVKNAPINTVVAFHPGAARFYREAGIVVAGS